MTIYLSPMQANALKQAHQLLQLQPLFLDTETTGLNNAQVIEIAIIDSEGQVLINQRIKPSVPITPGATAIHRITEHDLIDCPIWHEVHQQIADTLLDREVVIYNAAFDRAVIVDTVRAYKMPFIKFRSHCAMLLYSDYIGEYSSYWGNNRWQRLAHAVHHFDLPKRNQHCALDDALNTLDLLQAMSELHLRVQYV